jgi:hypothetical protein
MQETPMTLDYDFTGRETSLCLTAFILYEDVVTGKRAKETCDILDGRLGPGWEIEIGMSSFKSLHIPEFRQLAAEAVQNSSLVIYSCYDGHLPVEVCHWTESCLSVSGRPKSLVALIASPGSQTEPSRPAEKYLADIAQQRGLKFFSHIYAPDSKTAKDCLMKGDPSDVVA